MAGEPIFLVVDVRNIGTETIAYADGNGHLDMIVLGAQRKKPPNLLGCYAGFVEGGGGGVYDPPLMKPGETRSSWYLLKGYNLTSGEHILHVSGKVGVSWNPYLDSRSGVGVVAAHRHAFTDPMIGELFDASLKLIILDGSDGQLRQRYATYLAHAQRQDEESWRAREAIAEMAPPFLEKTLSDFADQSAELAVKGLGQIATTESRNDLIALFDRSADLKLRALIVRKLAGIATVREVPFFTGLLSNSGDPLDDEIYRLAVLGLGRAGGIDAVNALRTALHGADPDLQGTVVIALGNSKHPSAIPVLIEIYHHQSGLVRDNVCSALMTLTHNRWCDDSLGDSEETVTKWRHWWESHGAQVPLYDSNHCASPAQTLPPLN